MTEEEKAKESARKNCPMPFNWNEIDVARQDGYTKGYLAGAKENKELLERAIKIIEELHEIVVNKVEYKSTILMWNTVARAEKLLKEEQNENIKIQFK